MERLTAIPNLGKPSKVLGKLFAAYKRGETTIALEGGTRSGKSFSTMLMLISLCTTTKNLRVSGVSISGPHMRRGILRDMLTILEATGNWDERRMSWTNMVYKFPTKSYIELFGLEDETRARGPGRDILFLNEANLVKRSLYDQLAMRTTGCKIIDYNPADFSSWVYDLADAKETCKIHSTYLDNLHNLSDSQLAVIEGYQERDDPYWWQVYGLGLRGRSGVEVFHAFELYDETPEGGDVFYGLDFGYVHPNAMVRVTYHEGVFYAEEAIYKSGQTKAELAEQIRALDTGAAFIYCDSSEVDTIAALAQEGFNVHKARKDVWAGIMAIKSQRVRIKRSSENLRRELQGYKWKEDKDGNALEEPVKADDDAVDALRYAIHSYLSLPQFDWFRL